MTEPEEEAVTQTDVKVVYIVAWKRSGTTILGNALGEMDGFFHAGELRTLWGWGLMRGRLCGCGVPVGECSMWKNVLATSGVGKEVSPEEVRAWHRDAVRMRNLGRLRRFSPGRPSGWNSLDRYAELLGRTYRSISSVTGAQVIVDSSKEIPDAELVARLTGITPYFVHLVRDPRAVAHSWQRRKHSPGERKRQEMMVLGPARSTRSWLTVNLLADALSRRVPQRSLRLRYEKFVAEPHATLRRIAALVGESPTTTHIEDGAVRLGINHTAGGNPSRLVNGLVELHEDNEWRFKQALRDRILVTALALPTLHRYGYPVMGGLAKPPSRVRRTEQLP